MRRGRARIALDRALSHAFTRLPLLGRLWAHMASLPTPADVPWTPLATPLAACRAALITTGGVHLRRDPPFDMRDRHGDPTFREIPAGAATVDLRITHDYYDHHDADRDVNIVFPLERFRELVARGVLAGLTVTHWSFMGHIDGPLVRALETVSIPMLIARLHGDRPDFVFLVPA